MSTWNSGLSPAPAARERCSAACSGRRGTSARRAVRRRERGGLRAPLRAPLPRHPRLLPPHAGLSRGGRGRGPADLHRRLPDLSAVRQARSCRGPGSTDRPQPLPRRCFVPAVDRGLRGASPRPSALPRRSAPPGPARPVRRPRCASRRISGRRSCSPSSAASRTSRSPRSSTAQEKVKSLVFQARSSLMKSKEARDISCEDIRSQLSVSAAACPSRPDPASLPMSARAVAGSI